MPGPQRLKKLKGRRVVHKSTGGTLHAIPQPVDPVGNAPSSPFNTVAHPPHRRRCVDLSLSGRGEGLHAQAGFGGQGEEALADLMAIPVAMVPLAAQIVAAI